MLDDSSYSSYPGLHGTSEWHQWEAETRLDAGEQGDLHNGEEDTPEVAANKRLITMLIEKYGEGALVSVDNPRFGGNVYISRGAFSSPHPDREGDFQETILIACDKGFLFATREVVHKYAQARGLEGIDFPRSLVSRMAGVGAMSIGDVLNAYQNRIPDTTIDVVASDDQGRPVGTNLRVSLRLAHPFDPLRSKEEIYQIGRIMTRSHDVALEQGLPRRSPEEVRDILDDM